MEFCTGLQDNEKDLDEFFKEHPEFPQKNPLDLDYYPDEGERKK